MSIQTFSDRFTYGTTVTTTDLDLLFTDEDLYLSLPLLKPYVNQVKSHSVLLSGDSLSARYIYDICTLDSDPRISLMLAAAKDLSNTPLFPNLDAVKQLMFGPRASNTTLFDKDEYNIFVDGIRRASAAFTAAKLINQLAIIDEQFKHSSSVEKQAIDDIDRLIKLNSIRDLSSPSTSPAAEDYVASLYFEIKDFTIIAGETLSCEVFMPSVDYDTSISLKTVSPSSWVPSFTLTSGIYNTSEIVALVSDTINTITLNNRSANILAAPLLTSTINRHEIKFDARLKSEVLAAEIVSLRFMLSNNSTLPFKWGSNYNSLSTSKLNSVILAIQNGKVASTTSTSSASNHTPIVLYIKRGPLNNLNQPIDNFGNPLQTSSYTPTSKLSLRVSTRNVDSVTIDVPYISTPNALDQINIDRERPAQIADLIIQELYKIKTTTRTLGVLFKSDPASLPDPVSAIELICFTATNPDTWSILDVLEIPADIYIATGDFKGPTTPYSNNPKAIRVNNLFVSSKILSNTTVTSGESSSTTFVSFKKPKIITSINDRVNRNRFL